MQPCPQCKRHLKIGEAACPFCGNARLSRAALLASVALASPGCWTNASSTPATTAPVTTPAETTGAPGVVTGIITNGTTGAPLVGYTLWLSRPDGSTQEAATDRNGRYTFADVPPGAYKVVVPSDDRRRDDEERAVTVKSGDTVHQDFTRGSDLDKRMKMPYGAPPARKRVV